MNTVEKVARALCTSDGVEPEMTLTLRKPNIPAWKLYEDNARAALMALREPSDAMIAAFYNEVHESAESKMAAMIDAALAEGGGE